MGRFFYNLYIIFLHYVYITDTKVIKKIAQKLLNVIRSGFDVMK